MNLMSKYHCEEALAVINGPLMKELDIHRCGGINRTKVQLFELGGRGGRQFALVVGDLYAEKEPRPAKQSRILLEECELPKIPGIEPCDDYMNGSRVKQADSRLKPPHQTSCFVSDETSLKALLQWYAGKADFAQKQPANDSVTLERARVEKAAQDAGFDINPVLEDGWLIFRSTLFQGLTGVAVKGPGSYKVRLSDARWGAKVAKDCSHTVLLQDGPWPALVEDVGKFEELYLLLMRAAVLARLLSAAPLAAFKTRSTTLPATTEAERLVVQRVGQDVFRQALMEYWQGRCAVTGLDVVPLLRASHIKRWAKCNSDAERLDVFNGLLLAPHVDALFDGGWVTFVDTGEIRISEKLGAEQRGKLGISGQEAVAGLADQHKVYLAWHRANLFR